MRGEDEDWSKGRCVAELIGDDELRDERDLYCIGGDIATGEGSSRCAGAALNCRMNRTAAVIDADIRPDEHALQLWFMSRYYGGALIAHPPCAGLSEIPHLLDAQPFAVSSFALVIAVSSL